MIKTTYACIAHAHDLRLLAVAVLVCMFGSWAAIRTLERAGTATDDRGTWVALATVVAATTAWTTHFVAMIAYQPGMPVGFDVAVSVMSLTLAFLGCGVGMSLAARRTFPFAPEAGGAILGASVAAMHFVGMEAYRVPGQLAWQSESVVAAIVLAIGFGALSLSRASRPVTKYCRYGGMASLMLAIVGLHFTAMSALTVTYNPLVAIGTATVPDSTFAYAIAAVAAMLFIATAGAQIIEKRMAASSALRMKRLGEATTEGIVIIRDGKVVDFNQQILVLLETTSDLFSGIEARKLWDRRGRNRREGSRDTFQSEVTGGGGQRIPVEVVATRIAESEWIYAFRDLRQNRANEARLRYMALHDALTGLANRASFNATLDLALSEGRPLGLIYIDLDRFKEVNDQHGHAAGDAVLVEAAGRLKTAFGDGVAARLGGDEFAVLVDLGEGDDDAEARLATRTTVLASEMASPFRLCGRTLNTAGSFGLAFHPRHGEGREALMAAADMAMYLAKSERIHGSKTFNSAMAAAARRRRRIEQDLAAAVTAPETSGLAVHYQVQTDIDSGKVIGFEALARWTHPEFGSVSPAEFIPIAESTGAIGVLGAWVTGRACRDALLWDVDVKVAINLSPAQLASDVVGMVGHALHESGLDPRRLEVEVTESMLIADKGKARDQLQRIRAMGVSVALDDFGTGWSSLSTLQAFPFDRIKIDRSFVELVDSSKQARAIVRAIVNLGLSLNIPVLAEGVQNDRHVAFLVQHGCRFAQGYLMGRPEAIESTLRHMVVRRLLPTAA